MSTADAGGGVNAADAGGANDLRAERLRIARGGRMLVDGVDVTATGGTVTAIVGPNGAGKSTLLRLIAGILAADDGAIAIGDTDLAALGRRARARRIALLEQEWVAADGLRVREVVRLGRLPHQPLLGGESSADDAIVADSLHRAGATALADRDLAGLSGGERQRVNLARALAQQPDVLLCDEPTNHLDLRAQLDTLRLLRAVAHAGTTVVATLHDLNHAASVADRVIVVAHGAVRHAGAPADVLTADVVAHVWDVPVEVLPHADGRPLIVLGRA
ncbi:ABC transporter ATP-binding protein [Microbacterium sp. No. 7]|uniref:ABC transporter ATP-binding protein n=1 Tax=Microbacterium sp. No. 7 TaxID=1714373 RepID=UPI0006D16A9F|nr:ABC transporter ATP-binding protein [Microbacterium sp. No. 7]ALJ18809.1 hypothetical protein AOA12_02325 [Microbacterium sp. No. 7]